MVTHVGAQTLVEVGKGYSRTSVNTTVFRNNSLVTYKDTQYIAYYDADCYMVIGKRKLDSRHWELKRSQYKGHCADAHNIISLMADGDGYLHVAFDHHGQPLNYCKSVSPGSLELGEKIPMTGVDEGNVTYPEFYKLANGDLIFVYRSGSSGRGNLVMNRYALKTKSWQRVQDVLIDGEDQRNAYWQICVDEAGTIHLSWVWRETWMVETNHDLCYARSRDGGKTWEKSDGEKYTLPINAANAEYACHIPQKSELINQTSMCADKNGHPYIATYWRNPDSKVPQYRLVWYDGEKWQQQQVSHRITPFSLSGGGTKLIPMARPRLVIKQEGTRNKIAYIFRDVERGNKVSMACSDSLKNNQWKYTDLTDFSVGAWEPSYDTELWENRQELQLFVQRTEQGDGEKTVAAQPEPIYILENIKF
nr:BNR repeat-containing protein [uncultured Bacteroides sp.]